MTVQVSVLVWTVICFLALMLVLDRLLFRPMLAFMDARREKIDRAKGLRETAQADRQTELARRRAAREQEQQRLTLEGAQKLEEARRATAQAVEQRKIDNARWLEAMQDGLDEESQTIRSTLEPLMDEMAVAFANRLLDWPEETAVGRELTASTFPTIE